MLLKSVNYKIQEKMECCFTCTYFLQHKNHNSCISYIDNKHLIPEILNLLDIHRVKIGDVIFNEVSMFGKCDHFKYNPYNKLVEFDYDK